jgi:hypothetical protein
MGDHQYVSSFAMTAGVLTVLLGGLVCVVLWMGWVVAAVLVTLAGGALLWFYRGPRPDLAPKTGDKTPDELKNCE